MDIAARIGNHSSVSWKRICDNNLKKTGLMQDYSCVWKNTLEINMKTKKRSLFRKTIKY